MDHRANRVLVYSGLTENLFITPCYIGSSYLCRGRAGRSIRHISLHVELHRNLFQSLWKFHVQPFIPIYASQRKELYIVSWGIEKLLINSHWLAVIFTLPSSCCLITLSVIIRIKLTGPTDPLVKQPAKSFFEQASSIFISLVSQMAAANLHLFSKFARTPSAFHVLYYSLPGWSQQPVQMQQTASSYKLMKRRLQKKKSQIWRRDLFEVMKPLVERLRMSSIICQARFSLTWAYHPLWLQPLHVLDDICSSHSYLCCACDTSFVKVFCPTDNASDRSLCHAIFSVTGGISVILSTFLLLFVFLHFFKEEEEKKIEKLLVTSPSMFSNNFLPSLS